MKKNLTITFALLVLILSIATVPVNAMPIGEQDLDIHWISGDYDIPVYFTSSELFKEGYIVLYDDDEKMTILDMNGKKFIPKSYDLILYEDGFFRLFNNNAKNKNEFDFSLKIIDKNRKEWTEGEWNNKTAKYNEGYKIHFKDGKYGYIDENKDIVIPCKYIKANDFDNGFATVYPSENIGQIINKKGEVLVEEKVNNVYDIFLFGNDFYRLDYMENVVIKSIESENYLDGEYDFFYIVNDDLYRYKKDGKVGVANKSGSVLLEMHGYDVSVHGNIVRFYTDKKIIYKNINGTKLVESECTEDGDMGLSNIIFDKYIVYYDNMKRHIIDESGKEVNIFDKYNFKYFLHSSEGLLHCTDAITDEQCYIDENGKKVISIDGYNLGGTNFNSGYAWITKNDKQFNTIATLINKKGEKLIELENISDWGIINESIVYVNRINNKIKDENGDFVWNLGLINLESLVNKGLKSNTEEKSKNEKPETKVKAITTPCNLSLDGKKIDMMEAYIINDHNYFKLRDIAKLANDTDAKFSVAWNEDKKLISLVTKQPYEVVGTELKGGDKTDKIAIVSNSKVEINGEEVALDAYLINDENYYQIRDLSKALDFIVEWNNETKTVELKMNK